MKKICSLCTGLFLGSVMIMFAGCNNAADGDTKIICLTEKVSADTDKVFDVKVLELEKKTVDIKNSVDTPDATKTLDLYFMQGKEDIPYVLCNDEFMQDLVNKSIKCSTEVNAGTKEITYTNTKENTNLVVDLSKHTMEFENVDLFFKRSSYVYMDPAAIEIDGDYIKIVNPVNIAGTPVTVDWSEQDLGLVIIKYEDKDGKTVYGLGMPLSTFGDFFLPNDYVFLTYNGKDAYWTYNLPDTYWTEGNKGGKRSEALAEFCYNELCLSLDFNYGLKAIHGIDEFKNFDSYFAANGLDKKLKSTDADTFTKAIDELCEFYFSDGHSYYYGPSHYLSKSYKTGVAASETTKLYYQNDERYKNVARKNSYGSSIPGYEVSSDGKTAIVRFDSFTVKENPAENKAQKLAKEDGIAAVLNEYVGKYEEDYDTVVFIHYVNKLIQADSNIENVVLDLSCNSGGAVHSAAFLIAWMLGKCNFDVTDPISGAKYSACYIADVDFDGNYMDSETPDTGDTIKDKNLYCIISPISFSCGNLVPSVLKASGRVTILGEKSSGGTSYVQPLCAADGTRFQVSGKYLMSCSVNGSYYDIDQGIEPHYNIRKPENFYDIETIDSIIKSIK